MLAQSIEGDYLRSVSYRNVLGIETPPTFKINEHIADRVRAIRERAQEDEQTWLGFHDFCCLYALTVTKSPDRTSFAVDVSRRQWRADYRQAFNDARDLFGKIEDDNNVNNMTTAKGIIYLMGNMLVLMGSVARRGCEDQSR